MSPLQSNDTLHEWTKAAPYWERHAATIRTMFAPVTRALIEDAGIRPGQAVLDVAGGPGEPSLSIGEVVGPTGSVMCTDAVAEMVSAAERAARRRGGMAHVSFCLCCADALPFAEASFDVVVSRLGVMFFGDPLAAFREMLRVTKPQGRLAFAVWYKSELNPFSYVVTEVVARYIETMPADNDAPGAFRFAESGKLASIVADSGAIDVQERILQFRIEAPISLDEFWELRSAISGSLRDKLAGLPAGLVLRVGQDVKDAVREFFPHNRMNFPAQMIIVSGSKPPARDEA